MSEEKRVSNVNDEAGATQPAGKSSESAHPGGADAQSASTLWRGPQLKRRTFLTGSAVAATTATSASFFPGLRMARAQESGPVKIGFIEDESGNLSVYGLQKLHAAQLAVKEINEGKTLKGGANIGTGGYGPLAAYAGMSPVISKEGVGLDVVGYC